MAAVWEVALGERRGGGNKQRVFTHDLILDKRVQYSSFDKAMSAEMEAGLQLCQFVICTNWLKGHNSLTMQQN